MTRAPLKVLTYVAFPMVATVAGGLAASARPMSPRVRSGVQHFAAGVVFAAIAGELLPDVLHGKAPLQAVLGFILGVAVMFGVKRLTERLSPAEDARAGLQLGLITAVGIDALLDGLVIGIGYAAGARQGALVAVALTLEMLFLGLASAATLKARGTRSASIFALLFIMAILLAVGALVGATVLSGLPGRDLTGVLAFGTATLLYLVTEELLVSAHEVEETPLVTVSFFVGFLVVLIVELLL